MMHLLLKYGFSNILIASFLNCSFIQSTHNSTGIDKSDSLFLNNVPSQPGEDTWKFIADLKAPMWTKHAWVKAAPGSNQADLSSGVRLQMGFPDTRGRLETAYEDFRSFLDAGEVSSGNGKYLIETAQDQELKGESFRLEVKPGGCRIVAGDVDGIRRGIFYLEDEMLRRKGPFLSLGKVEKHPILQRRISRCFFGPIKRFPKMRDELMDSVNYYPDQYLNRMAHEGVNGLWLTVEFRDLAKTSFTPEAGKDAAKRLAKLQQTVDACLRYGIRTYIFCIEPRVLDADSPVLKYYPELAGGAAGDKHYYFCSGTETARKYLYESVNTIFKAVPELGGMINISVGERATICLTEGGHIICPRCSHKAPWEVLNASLSAMEQGMHDAAPEAELISWLYLPQPQRFDTGDSYDLDEWVYELAEHTPKDVILQFNFESGVSRTEFGKLLVGGDYWISTPGPSSRFSRVAELAKSNGTEVSAKIQTGNSHEVATVPYIPVPSLLYQKFSEMKRLGVTHTMLCWYFGSYPGLMNKSAGELSFEPFPKDENTFLHQLATIYWRKEDVSKVVEAWKYFSKGYENYPLINLFQYYGPMADGPVWPLLLKPMDTPLSPTWQIGSSRTRKPWPPSGDRVGECIGDVMTLKETVELAHRMSTAWDHGVDILNGIEHHYRNEPERILEIGVARALGIQFRSGYNILHFYLLREEMLRMEGRERLNILKQLGHIINEELDLDKQLIELCEKDSRLGFHSEAEGYKYFPEKLRWRMQQLKNLLANDMPEMEKLIHNDKLLFPEYTGKKPAGPVAYSVPSEGSLWSGSGLIYPKGLGWQQCEPGAGRVGVRWGTCYDAEALYIMVMDSLAANQSSQVSSVLSVEIRIEPQRLFPTKHFVFQPQAEKLAEDVRVVKKSGIWHVVARIPLERIGLESNSLHPVRINVLVQNRNGETSSWRPNNPVTERLILGTENPADLGWLLFQK